MRSCLRGPDAVAESTPQRQPRMLYCLNLRAVRVRHSGEPDGRDDLRSFLLPVISESPSCHQRGNPRPWVAIRLRWISFVPMEITHISE
jgi:hypothetical protein